MCSQPFSGVDFLDVDDQLAPEERQARDDVRSWVESDLLPIIAEHHRNETFPEEVISDLADLGVLGANIDHGATRGRNPVAYGLIMQELERGDSGLRSFSSVQGALCMYPIHQFGTDEQRKKYLPPMANGEVVGCFGLTEPDAGSNPAQMQMHAKRDGDEWVLNGTKKWITNGTLADVAVIWAKLPDEMEEDVGGFLVEADRDGYQAHKITGKFSMRVADTAEIVLDQVRIPEANRFPQTEGLKSALRCLNQARYGIAWGVVGSAMACYHTALEYAKAREQFDQPIASFQLVQRKLTNMLSEITRSQLMNLRLGRLKQNDEVRHAQISMAKRDNTSAALDIARTARDLLGANGIVDEYPIMRHVMNLETVYTYEGTHDIHTLIVGEDITGIPAFE